MLVQVLPTEQFVYSICVNKRQKDSNELSLNIRSMCCCFSFFRFSFFLFFIYFLFIYINLHPPNTRIVVICCFFLSFIFTIIIILPIQRRSHRRKTNKLEMPKHYINLFAHVYFLSLFLSLCFGLLLDFVSLFLSLCFIFFFSFEKLQSSDMYVCLTLFLSVFLKHALVCMMMNSYSIINIS